MKAKLLLLTFLSIFFVKKAHATSFALPYSVTHRIEIPKDTLSPSVIKDLESIKRLSNAAIVALVLSPFTILISYIPAIVLAYIAYNRATYYKNLLDTMSPKDPRYAKMYATWKFARNTLIAMTIPFALVLVLLFAALLTNGNNPDSNALITGFLLGIGLLVFERVFFRKM
jgi:hypothetical protein